MLSKNLRASARSYIFLMIMSAIWLSGLNKNQIMSNRKLCEALYALPDNIIIKRRKSLFVPIVLLVVGVVLIVANNMLQSTSDLDNLRSALILFGGSFLCVGLVILFMRFSDSGFDPYHSVDGCFLKREELKFQKEQRSMVLDLLSKRDFTTLRALPSEGISALMVVLYFSPKSDFCVAQAFEYVDLELQAVSEPAFRK